MATLKSIKNSYNQAAVDINTENVSLLAFNIATVGELSKFNLIDGFSDDYQDATGVDESSSTNEARNAANYFSGTIEGSYNYDAFTSTGAATWTCPANTAVAEVLIVAGGGGGSNEYYGGGAGAGGVVHDEDYAVVATTVYDLSVGAGGAKGNTGSNSVWNVNAEGSGITMTANGGGYGGGSSAPGAVGGAGGSGGGNDNDTSSGTGGASNQPDFSGATSYGGAGGARSAMGEAGGGGGGAGEVTPGTSFPYPPGNASNGIPGAAGRLFSNFVAYGTDSDNVASTGSNGGYFAGGGGGGAYTGSPTGQLGGTGGVGGGGRGGGYASGTDAQVGIVNTGGGGGTAGGSHGGASSQGAVGGSGIIVIRHRVLTYDNMTLFSEAYTAQTQPTTIRIMMDEYTSTGSATVNTDIKVYASRDNGTTYDQILSLASQGTIETNHRFLSGSLDVSGQPAGTSMKYKIETLNQSSSKQTRVYGVSMAWA